MPDLQSKSGCKATINNLIAVGVLLGLLAAAVSRASGQAATEQPDATEAAAADGLPQLAPSLTAPAHAAHAWTSEGGLKYAWVVPPGLTAEAERDLVVILHGTGLDHRWGFANNQPGQFRPGDILVSPDGTSDGLEDTRLFMGRQEDADAFAAFLEEMKRAFPVRRVFLYGHSQGSFFALYFAGERPDLVDGVVAHASGAWSWTKLDGGLLDVPVVFLHGTADPVVPYIQSVGSRDAFYDGGHEMVQLRRMPRYNHWPNAARAGECLDWAIGMRTDDPAEALARALAILTPKGKDEYEYECPVWFSAANDLLTRIIGRHAQSFVPAAKDLEAVRAQARPLLEAVEAEGARHVAKLREHVRTRGDLKLDGGPWLGHLTAVREDFRGVRPVEEYARAIGYDEVLAAHREASIELSQSWYRRAGARETFETIVRVLPSCFLVEGLPPGMEEQVPKWFQEAVGMGVSPEAIRGYRHFLMWQSGRQGGRQQYRELSDGWKGPQ